jgi:ABC-type uncharacterized transport system fused permease/ATPase subunit
VFKESIAKFLKLDQVLESLTGYVETKIEILKYDLKEDLSKVLSKLSVYLIIIFAATFFLLFFSAALAFELSRHLGTFGGFALVSAVYVVAGIIVYINRGSLARKLEAEFQKLIKQKKKQ